MALALIPARLCSKDIPNKNFTPLNGISPVERAVTCCLAAGITPWVSSDGPNTLKWRWWLDRPADLATDTASMIDVVKHFLSNVPGPDDEAILLVQPSQPLRTPEHLKIALSLLQSYVNVVSVVETTSTEKLFYLSGDRLIPCAIPVERRQSARSTYLCDGTFYGFHRADWLSKPRFSTATPYMINPALTCSLDTPLDWQIAELRLKALHEADRTTYGGKLATP